VKSPPVSYLSSHHFIEIIYRSHIIKITSELSRGALDADAV
jgi:hypothetical protein